MSKVNDFYKSIQLSEQLDILHRQISEKNIPVQKKDSFDEQCIVLEKYIGGSKFKTYCQKMKMANTLSGCFAFPVLLAIIGFYINSKINKAFDIFKFITNNPIIYILGGMVLILVLCLATYFYFIKKKLYGLIYSELKDKLDKL